jgi:hypothetical protein
MKNLIGKKVKVISENDSYDPFRNKILIVTHQAQSIKEHPGYDPGVFPDLLCDFVTVDGTKIPYSLYEYEFEVL